MLLSVRETLLGTRLETLRQEGCLRVCLPRTYDSVPQAVLLNTSGGITDGDVLRFDLVAGAATALIVTTQAAERIYRARPEAAPAQVTTRVTVAAGSRLEYLPQETILFDGSALHRSLHVDMAADATYLGVETLLFGRIASAEILREIRLRDSVFLCREGRLVLHDSIRVRGSVADALVGAATAAGAGACASLTYAAPDAADALNAVRAALAPQEARCGATWRDGVLMARMVATDGARACLALRAALAVVRRGRPLPAVWNC